MDKTEQFIKQCEKAPKLLEVWNDGDLYAYGIDEPECPDRYTNVRMVHYCEEKPKTDAIRIYRQDQLQILSGLSWKEFDKECLKYDVYTKEQAGIQVVMKRLAKTTQ